MIFLKKLTSGTAVVQIGPVMDDDGVTPYTSTLVATDVKISKNGGTYASKNESTAPSHDADGWFRVTLDSTDLGTLGNVKVRIVKTGCLQAWVHIHVVEYEPTTAQTDFADAHLNRDMSAVTVTNARSPINALRFLRNKWAISAGTLTVYKEDDSTSAWTSALTTNASADPVVTSDPA